MAVTNWNREGAYLASETRVTLKAAFFKDAQRSQKALLLVSNSDSEILMLLIVLSRLTQWYCFTAALNCSKNDHFNFPTCWSMVGLAPDVASISA